MKDTRAEAFRGQLDPSGIAIEVGYHGAAPQAQSAEEGGAAIVLTDRIHMPPATAKRLVLVLGETLGRYPPGALSAEPDRRGVVPVNAPPDATGEQGALLLRLVGELGAPCQHERSFRLSEGELMANRFLLSLNAGDIPPPTLERVLGIGDRLGMPPAARQAAAEDFGHAACVHFGFEGGEGGAMAKLYFERAIAPKAAQAAHERGETLLLHRAFKWDTSGAGDAKFVVTEYRWHPHLDAVAIGGRLARLYGEENPSLAIVRGVLDLAMVREAGAQLQYLEVEEENGRRSFDLNLYDAKLRVSDAQRLLDAMRERCGIRPGRFQALYDQIKVRPLGHIAGGVHRNGLEFYNVYYGVTGYPLFSHRFR